MTAATRRPRKRATHEGRLTLTRPEPRAAVRAVFYPAIPTWDVQGEERVDRATQRLLDAVEAGRR